MADLLPSARHDTHDIGLRFIVMLLAGIGTILVLMLGLAWLIYPQAIQDRVFRQPFPSFPTPRLQASPRTDMQAFHAAEMARLHGTGWADRAAQRVHIPIDRAMQDVARDGIADWPRP